MFSLLGHNKNVPITCRHCWNNGLSIKVSVLSYHGRIQPVTQWGIRLVQPTVDPITQVVWEEDGSYGMVNLQREVARALADKQHSLLCSRRWAACRWWYVALKKYRGSHIDTKDQKWIHTNMSCIHHLHTYIPYTIDWSMYCICNVIHIHLDSGWKDTNRPVLGIGSRVSIDLRRENHFDGILAIPVCSYSV